MGLKCLLYVSRAVLPPSGGDEEVARIVARSRARNQALQVTGALVFTNDHFAQILEGPPESVDLLFAAIEADRRHAALRCYQEWPARRFYPDWSMAYSGPSTFVDRRIRPLFAAMEARPESLARAELKDLMHELARAAGPAAAAEAP